MDIAIWGEEGEDGVMARPLRIDVAGGWYHVGARGIEQGVVFCGRQELCGLQQRPSCLPTDGDGFQGQDPVFSWFQSIGGSQQSGRRQRSGKAQEASRHL